MAEVLETALGLDSARILTNEPISDAEWQVRVDLAAAYRLAQIEGWDELIYNHISVRVPGSHDHFLLNPFGLSFDEVTASNLVKVDLDGNIIGNSKYPINSAGFTIHSAVHAARPEVECVLHLHTEAGMAISMLEDGLLPLNQTAMLFHGRFAYHEYEGIALDLAERERLIQDLGDKPLMILRNHGTLVTGRSVGDAWVQMWLLDKACRAQLQAMACNTKLHQPSPEAAATPVRSMQKQPRYGGTDTAWEAMKRRLDRIDTSYKN